MPYKLLPHAGNAEHHVQLLRHLQTKGCGGFGLDVHNHNWSLRMLRISTVRVIYMYTLVSTRNTVPLKWCCWDPINLIF